MLYAKSNPEESIKEHTDNLIKRLEELKEIYGGKIPRIEHINKKEIWDLLKLACQYHDIGKAYTPFQNMICSVINQKEVPTEFNYQSVKHEQLSCAFVPIDDLNLNHQDLKILLQAIYYHHERKNGDIEEELINTIIKQDFVPRSEQIETETLVEINKKMDTYFLKFVKGRNRINVRDDSYEKYCLVKGLLQRLDYSASAHIEIEDDTKEVLSEFTQEFMEKNKYDCNELQEFCKNNQEENLVVIGSTGMGKTEGALLWSGNDKTFFTLPIRISINDIYSRINDLIGYKHVGLLHSTALDYLQENEKEIEKGDSYKKYKQAQMLASKITTCTIDQIFPFVFKYKGYERIYATLSYAKIIIDEIQGYSPDIVAIILKGLQMIHQMGGRFMIMTATLPRIYKEELAKMGIEFKYGEFLKETKRHKIQMENKVINDATKDIKEKGESHKVIIIVNTINKAIELYKQLKVQEAENVKLLHSRFIVQDRSEIEKEIKHFSKNIDLSGIWITTQIVEASLDIDFDYLYTEMSTLDSLFQRLGRCYRSREYENKSPNVYIFCKDVTGIGPKNVYDRDIHEKSIQLLEIYNGKILEEKDKIMLVDVLYSNEMLKNTNFLTLFREGMKVLNELSDYDLEKLEAQKLIRNIDTIKVIPKVVYDQYLDLFEKYSSTKENKIKSELKKSIDKLTISIRKVQSKIFCDKIFSTNIEDIFGIDLKYDKDIGLLLERDGEYDITSREF